MATFWVRSSHFATMCGVLLTLCMYVWCLAHTLQLCFWAGAVAVARKLVGHFRHSVVATTALKEKQTQLEIPMHSLIQDVATLNLLHV